MNPIEFHQAFSEFMAVLATNKTLVINTGQESFSMLDHTKIEWNIIQDFVINNGVTATNPDGTGIFRLNKRIATAFNSQQNRFVLKFSGVYSHHKPMITRQNDCISVCPNETGCKTNNCELGDVCFITLFLDKNKKVLMAKSFMAQAKKTPDLDSERQRCLYDSDWYFNYQSKAFYEKTITKTSLRYLPHWGNGRERALRYLILNSDTNHQPKNRFVPWAIDHNNDFGFSLYRMLAGADGMHFFPDTPLASDWSMLMDDLIRMAAGHMKSSSIRGIPSELNVLLNYFNNYRNHDLWNAQTDNENFPNVPLVLAIIQDTGNDTDH